MLAVYLLLHSLLMISLCQVTHFYQSSFYHVQESDVSFLFHLVLHVLFFLKSLPLPQILTQK